MAGRLRRTRSRSLSRQHPHAGCPNFTRRRSGERRTRQGTGGTQHSGHRWAVNIRKYVVRAAHLDDLVALGSLTPAAARFLSASVAAGLNVLVSGPTQAGKTTESPIHPPRRRDGAVAATGST